MTVSTEKRTELRLVLDEYEELVAAWQEQCKKQATAVQKLRTAVQTGRMKDIEKLRKAAQAHSEAVSQKAAECTELGFDITAYMQDPHGYRRELSTAARRAGVKLQEREGIIFCYPVLVSVESASKAVRIGKKNIFELNPERVAQMLKKEQEKEPKTNSSQFLNALFRAYEYVRQSKKGGPHVALPLKKLYKILTLLPGVTRDYRLLDFARDIYFLDANGPYKTDGGFQWTLSSSTSTREGGSDTIWFVNREGQQKLYHSVLFTPPQG